MREAIGRYRVVGRLGEGGMGVVYEAWDDRLGRSVAVKMIRATRHDPGARERFWREARAAGALSHPNICHIYEIGEDGEELFIAMERLTGESLAERLQRGPLSPRDAAQISLGALDALEAVHARGLLHRDLKPSNVYLTPHGVKLLDFGLAMTVATNTDQTLPMLTIPGVVLGTPGYMAPEQILAQPVDARSDLYAVGAMLFEMLSGKPPFQAATAAEILSRVLSERVPALSGPPVVIAIDRVIQRALARAPSERYQSAAEMAQELRGVLRFTDTATSAGVQAIRRLIVLPFRLLKDDSDIDFLSFGLADAISASLAGRDTLVVRSSLTAARYGKSTPDLATLTAEADVDLVLSGTVLRAADQIRVNAQLLAAPQGTLLWSHTLQVSMTDLFGVQDDLSRRIVESVSSSLGSPAAPVERVPKGKAHELFLRANQFAFEPRAWHRARELYERAVEEDPEYAAAWARLGRLYRVMGKYGSGADPQGDFARAGDALRKATSLEPELPMAILYSSQLEMELGRSRAALVDLLEHARRHPSDTYLLAGLVQACRYCGLVDASIAAHEHVRRLDRVILTGVVHSLWLKGDFDRALEQTQAQNEAFDGLILSMIGRDEEAVASLERDEMRFQGTAEADFCRLFRLALQQDIEGARALALRFAQSTTFIDPEGLHHAARVYCRIGDLEDSMQLLQRSLEGGFCGLPSLNRDPWLDPLRGRADFRALLDRADAFQRAAAAAYSAAGGERVLGVPPR